MTKQQENRRRWQRRAALVALESVEHVAPGVYVIRTKDGETYAILGDEPPVCGGMDNPDDHPADEGSK